MILHTDETFDPNNIAYIIYGNIQCCDPSDCANMLRILNTNQKRQELLASKREIMQSIWVSIQENNIQRVCKNADIHKLTCKTTRYNPATESRPFSELAMSHAS